MPHCRINLKEKTMVRRGRKFEKITAPKRRFKSAERMARRPMPKPASDMGDKKKFTRHTKYKVNWEVEIESSTSQFKPHKTTI